MARNWTKEIRASGFEYPSSSGAQPDQVPTTLRPCAAFDADSDESVIVPFTVPAEHTGSGTVKMDIWYCANTTTAADDARLDAATEFRTPAAGEAANADNFDATPDSVTGTHSTTAYSFQKATITLTPAVVPAAGDEGRIKLTRDADHATDDSLAVDLLITAVEVYEEV